MRVSEKTSCLPDPLVPLDTKDRVRTKTSKAQRAGKTSSASSKASNGAIKGCSDNNHDPQNPSQVHNAILDQISAHFDAHSSLASAS